METLLNAGVVGATLSLGHLILLLRDSSTIDVGEVLSGLPDGSTTVKGVVELATDVETATGTDSTRAVTPFALAALVASATAKGIVELATNAETITGTDAVRAVTPAGLAATSQPKDADLTAIAALTPANGDFLGFASGAYSNRTPAQAASTLSGSGVPIQYLHNGTAYVAVSGPGDYVGPTDPGAVANGSVWYDTTGA